MIFLICTLGYYIWAVAGWGSYIGFRYSSLGSFIGLEVKWIDEILFFSFGDEWVPGELTQDCVCLLGMALRGLHIAPLFIALAWYYSNPFIACLSCGMLLQGLIYYVFNSLLLPTCVKHNIDCNACAEYATGGLIGLLIVIMRKII